MTIYEFRQRRNVMKRSLISMIVATTLTTAAYAGDMDTVKDLVVRNFKHKDVYDAWSKLHEAVQEKEQLRNENGDLSSQHESAKTELQDIMKRKVSNH